MKKINKLFVTFFVRLQLKKKSFQAQGSVLKIFRITSKSFIFIIGNLRGSIAMKKDVDTVIGGILNLSYGKCLKTIVLNFKIISDKFSSKNFTGFHSVAIKINKCLRDEKIIFLRSNLFGNMFFEMPN